MSVTPLSRRIRRYGNEVVLVILILLMGLGVFLFFKSFFDSSPSNLAIEILAALLGSIITVMITMLLIRQQGTFEQAQETAAANKTKFFEKKLELFRDFISHYVKYALDGRLESHELAELEERALIISLLTNRIPKEGHKNLGPELCRFVLQLEKHGLHEAGRRDPVRFVNIMKLMKIELGVAQQADPEDAEDETSEEYRDAQELLNYRDYRIKLFSLEQLERTIMQVPPIAAVGNT